MGRTAEEKRFTEAELAKQTEGVICRKDKGAGAVPAAEQATPLQFRHEHVPLPILYIAPASHHRAQRIGRGCEGRIPCFTRPHTYHSAPTCRIVLRPYR